MYISSTIILNLESFNSVLEQNCLSLYQYVSDDIVYKLVRCITKNCRESGQAILLKRLTATRLWFSSFPL